MQCTAIEDTYELQAKANFLAHFNIKWHNNQPDLETSELSKISANSGEAFTAPMRQLVIKYAAVFTKPGKPVAWDIKHKIELLEPTKPKPHRRLLRMSGNKI